MTMVSLKDPFGTEANGTPKIACWSVPTAQFKFSSSFQEHLFASPQSEFVLKNIVSVFNSSSAFFHFIFSSVRLSIIGHLLFLLIFQFTATGVAGLHGLTVTSRAMAETRQESANAIILNQLSEEKTARVQQRKRTPAICTVVQVFIFAAILILPI